MLILHLIWNKIKHEKEIHLMPNLQTNYQNTYIRSSPCLYIMMHQFEKISIKRSAGIVSLREKRHKQNEVINKQFPTKKRVLIIAIFKFSLV